MDGPETVAVIRWFLPPHPRRHVPVPLARYPFYGLPVVSCSNVHEVELTASNKAQVPPVGITLIMKSAILTYHLCRPVFFCLDPSLIGRCEIICQSVAGDR